METLIIMLICILVVGISSLILIVKLDKFLNVQNLYLNRNENKNKSFKKDSLCNIE